MTAILEYHLLPSGGGVLIDPEGMDSAKRALVAIYGRRLDVERLVARYGVMP